MDERLSDEWISEILHIYGPADRPPIHPLAREVQEWRQMAMEGKCVNHRHGENERLIAAIDALHVPRNFDADHDWCSQDGLIWPCPTHLLIHPETGEPT